MTMMTTTATKVIQANNNNVPAAAYAAVRSVEEDNDNELIADTVHVSGFGDTIPEAADLTWQDDYYNGIPGVIGVFDPDATKAKRLLCIMGSVTLCLGVFVLALAIFVANAEANNGPHYYDDYYQNVEEKDGPSAFVLAFIVLGSVLGTFWMRLVVQFVEIHLAVTTEGVRLDIPLRSRVLRMVACSVQFFCIALPCFVCSQMPYFREDEDAYDAATSFRNWFLSFALIVLGLSLKRGIGPESLIIPFGDIERLGGTDNVWLILKKSGPPADVGNKKVLPKVANDTSLYDLVSAMMRKEEEDALRRGITTDSSGGVELVATAHAVPLNVDIPSNEEPVIAQGEKAAVMRS